MAAPFYNAIKGTTSGTPGTGAFTPNAASSGYLAWSTVPTAWIGLVRFEDGSSWELSYCYWNGTTLSRSSSQLFSSSSGSALSLTSSATAAMVVGGDEVQPHLITPWRGWTPVVAGTTFTALGASVLSVTGTGAGVTIANTNFLTEQPRVQSTSATTASAQAGWSNLTVLGLTSTTAGHGGWEFTGRFGASQLPTGPRVFIGLTSSSYVGISSEPSAHNAAYAILGKDSTDTNLQLITNSAGTSGTKVDTGIALVANGWYEVTIWSEPGSTTVKLLLVRLDTGAIFYTSTSTDVPPDATLLLPNMLIGLNGTNTGTAAVAHFGGMLIRTAS